MMGHSLLGVSCLRCPSGWAASEQGPPGVPPPRGFSPAPPQVPPMHRWASPHHHTHPSLASRTNREVRRKAAGPPGGVGPVQARRRPAGSLWGLRASLAEKQPLPHTHPCPAPPTLVACVVSWPIPSPGPFWGWGAPGSWGAREKVLDSRPQRPCPAPRPILVGTAPPWSGPQGMAAPTFRGWGPAQGGGGWRAEFGPRGPMASASRIGLEAQGARGGVRVLGQEGSPRLTVQIWARAAPLLPASHHQRSPAEQEPG